MLFSLGVTWWCICCWQALYESFVDPLIILLTVPVALMGALIGLQLRGLPLDVYGQMGLLVLISLAAKNGILIVEFANQRRAAGLALKDAIQGAAIQRMRPILLTTVTSLAGFLPLVLAQRHWVGQSDQHRHRGLQRTAHLIRALAVRPPVPTV